jgi:hypothetical protein
MQPGYPGSGQDPYSQQQPPYSDPYAQPQYPSPQYGDPYAQPQAPYTDPYAQPQPTSGNPNPNPAPGSQFPTSGNPYPTSGNPYPTSGGPYPTSGSPYPAASPYPGPEQYPGAQQYQQYQQYPAAPQYPVAGYGAPAGPRQSNTLGLLGMIFGIVALPLSVCCGLFSAPFSIAALVLSFLGLKRVNEGTASNRGQALAGVICGAVAVVLMIIMVAIGLNGNFGSFSRLR